MNRSIMLMFFLVIFSCKKYKEDPVFYCNYNRALVQYYFDKGNNILPEGNKNVPYGSSYYLYKEYNLINSLYFEGFISDSCSAEKANDLLAKQGYNIDTIKEKIKRDSILLKIKGFDKYSFINKDLDGVYQTFGYVKNPRIINNKFEDSLLTGILKIDPTFRLNGFWIVVDEKGNLKDVELYIKHSKKIDSLVEKALRDTKWKPGFIQKVRGGPKENVTVRDVFYLRNYNYDRLPNHYIPKR